MKLSTLFALVMLASFLFLAGCPSSEQKGEPAKITPGVEVPVAVPPVVAPAENNATPNATVNASEEEKEPVIADPFENYTLRSISDRIADGKFRINDLPGSTLEICVINNSFADSVFVNKGAFYMLIDSGNFEKTDAFLKQYGVERINVVVATRDYPGAVNGLLQVIENYHVDEFWENGANGSSDEYLSLLALVKAKGITVKHPKAGDSLEVSRLKMSVLNPQVAKMGNDPDNNAVVLRLSNGDFCALLLNPTIQEREPALMNANFSLACPVITYFKHGEGRPEQSVLVFNRASPKDVIISVGQNAKGLPSQTTLTTLEIHKMNVWRTDSNGSVCVESDETQGYKVGKYGENFSAIAWKN